jgi:acylglycerol lipase
MENELEVICVIMALLPIHLINEGGEHGLKSLLVTWRIGNTTCGTLTCVFFYFYLCYIVLLRGNNPFTVIQAFVAFIRKNVPEDIPFVLTGHSMGGCIALRYAQTRPDVFKAIAVSAPWLVTKTPVPKIILMASSILQYVYPRLSQAPAFHPEEMTHDPEIVEMERQNIKSGLAKPTATVNWFKQVEYMRWEVEKEPEAVKGPLIMVQGGEDSVVDPEANKKFFERLICEKRLEWYDHFFHEVLNELEREEPLSCIKDFFWTHLQLEK